jgi:hypothetical protein
MKSRARRANPREETPAANMDPRYTLLGLIRSAMLEKITRETA